MKTLLFKCLAVVLLVAAQGFGVSVWAQEYSEQIKARLIAHPESSTAIELEGGRTIIYRKLIELSANERKDIRKLAIDRNAWLNFQEWEMAAIEANNVEADKRLAAIRASSVPKIEEVVRILRKEIGEGKKQDAELLKSIAGVVKYSNGYLNAGLRKESLEYLESLLKRPELFEK